MSAAAHGHQRETPDIVTSSETYASRFQGEVGRYLLDVQRRCVLSLLDDGRPLMERAVIDVGGGHGQLAGPLAAQGCQVTVAGSDDVCAARLGREGSEGSLAFAFIACDLLAIPVADRQFDTVVSVRLISHMDRWRDLVAELCRIADRTVIIDYPTYHSVNALGLLTFPLKLMIEKNTRTYRSYFDRSIRNAFLAHGFASIRAERQFALPMVLHRALPKTPVLRSLEERMRSAGLTRRLGNPVLIRFDRMKR